MVQVQKVAVRSAEFIAENYAKPEWATGAITPRDAGFLHDLISQERPENMMEIGVASGTSTALISRSLTHSGTGKLYSFDALPYFYANKDIACGAFLDESFPTRPENVELTVGVFSSEIAGRFANDEKFDLVFIDANHEHPWPCLDMISAMAVTKPGAWVAHHDISLPFIHSEFPCYGPRYLISTWPGEKLVSRSGDGEGNAHLPNIGAVKLFASKEESLKAVLNCMCLKWDKPVTLKHIDMTAENIRRFAPSYVNEFLAICANVMTKPSYETRTVRISNPNDWTIVSGSPFNRDLVIHANRPDNDAVAVYVGLEHFDGDHLVLPAVKRCQGGPPVVFDVAAVDAKSGRNIGSATVTIDDDLPLPVVVRLAYAKCPISIRMMLTTPSEKTGGAWVTVSPLRFV